MCSCAMARAELRQKWFKVRVELVLNDVGDDPLICTSTCHKMVVSPSPSAGCGIWTLDEVIGPRLCGMKPALISLGMS
jgi:hypothetical protein